MRIPPLGVWLGYTLQYIGLPIFQKEHLPKYFRGRAVSLLASHQGDPGPIPGRATPDFRMWESCRTMSLVGRSSRGSSGAATFSRQSLSSALKTSMLRTVQNSRPPAPRWQLTARPTGALAAQRSPIASGSRCKLACSVCRYAKTAGRVLVPGGKRVRSVRHQQGDGAVRRRAAKQRDQDIDNSGVATNRVSFSSRSLSDFVTALWRKMIFARMLPSLPILFAFVLAVWPTTTQGKCRACEHANVRGKGARPQAGVARVRLSVFITIAVADLRLKQISYQLCEIMQCLTLAGIGHLPHQLAAGDVTSKALANQSPPTTMAPIFQAISLDVCVWISFRRSQLPSWSAALGIIFGNWFYVYDQCVSLPGFRSRTAGCSDIIDCRDWLRGTESILDDGKRERHRHDGNTARLVRRSDEALGVRVSVARIAPSSWSWTIGCHGLPFHS
ncbi:hypothetical protein PR048_016193 [Dryococelus australis]|uniref:Uncharacterized protein n=1 Tax=Dryococelus australis TaxID=614101 RepID=A0ABQ9HJ22_9NEOP|nr:hypothetical protein PR048_016193 [Dryococelus australis]